MQTVDAREVDHDKCGRSTKCTATSSENTSDLAKISFQFGKSAGAKRTSSGAKSHNGSILVQGVRGRLAGNGFFQSTVAELCKISTATSTRSAAVTEQQRRTRDTVWSQIATARKLCDRHTKSFTTSTTIRFSPGRVSRKASCRDHPLIAVRDSDLLTRQLPQAMAEFGRNLWSVICAA